MAEYPEKKVECAACALRVNACQVVKGRGSHKAPVLVLVDTPDDLADVTGFLLHPSSFQGKQWKWLLKELGLQETDCRISAAVACKPQSEEGAWRAPGKEHVNTCHYWVKKEIEFSFAAREKELFPSPHVLCLGSFAAMTLFGGQFGRPAAEYPCRWFDGSQLFHGVPIFVFMGLDTLRGKSEIVLSDWRERIKKCRQGLALSGIVSC